VFGRIGRVEEQEGFALLEQQHVLCKEGGTLRCQLEEEKRVQKYVVVAGQCPLVMDVMASDAIPCTVQYIQFSSLFRQCLFSVFFRFVLSAALVSDDRGFPSI